VGTLWATRKKTKAETNLFNTEIYSTMLGDLRAQINMQGDQLKNQAQQILNLQNKDVENIKVINLQQKRERQYLTEIKDLKATIKHLESKLESIQNQLSNEQS
jgi:chromosome segregation ATPase